ncbi:MAG: endo-1,4-beta-xylanase [Treponema sp.]|nr:endo-1,4-beta-xylanase [Treponema sp.]MCL2250912.1 endo-1,4-beta-xylanase [Treponema sp.]
MKGKIFISFFPVIALLLVFFGCGVNAENNIDDYDDTVILHTKWQFPVGVAVPGAKTTNTPNDNALKADNPQHALLKHFNVVVAENEMKPGNILPSNKPSKEPKDWSHDDPFFTWSSADELVNYAKENSKKIRGHTLIWHDQTPDWFFKSSSSSGRATINELYARMEHYIRVVFQKYGNDIKWWDVVNEAVDHDASGPRKDSRGRYTEIMTDAGKTGMDRYEYILKAFQWARQYADSNSGSDVELYLTDFGVERPFTRGGSTKQADFKELVEWLIEKEAPIDGVGFQGHFRLYDHPVDKNSCLTCIDKTTCNHDISSGIDLFSSIEISSGKKIKIQICELDISIFSNAKDEASSTSISNSNLPTRLSDLAQTYLDFFEMFEEKFDEGKLDMVVLWGIADGHSWLNNHPVSGRRDHPLLFNRKYRAKEAYLKLVDR